MRGWKRFRVTVSRVLLTGGFLLVGEGKTPPCVPFIPFLHSPTHHKSAQNSGNPVVWHSLRTAVSLLHLPNSPCYEHHNPYHQRDFLSQESLHESNVCVYIYIYTHESIYVYICPNEFLCRPHTHLSIHTHTSSGPHSAASPDDHRESLPKPQGRGVWVFGCKGALTCAGSNLRDANFCNVRPIHTIGRNR